MPTLINRLFPLRSMILESNRHNSVFGKWVVTSVHLKKLISFSAQIDCAFMEIDIIRSYKRKLFHVTQEESFFVSAKEEFIAAIKAMHADGCFHIQRFLEAYQNVYFVLDCSIEFLEEINKDFKEYLADKEKHPDSLIWEVIEGLDSLSQSNYTTFSVPVLEEKLETFQKELTEIIMAGGEEEKGEESRKNLYYRYKEFKSDRLNGLREQYSISENYKKEMMSSKNVYGTHN